MSIPKAKQESKILEAHGDQRHDEFYWLNQRENPCSHIFRRRECLL